MTATLIGLKVAFARLEKNVFVDLDQLAQLPFGTGAEASLRQSATHASSLELPSDKLHIILKEGEKIYPVPETEWSTAPLSISGDAGVLINRGAVLAPIPQNEIAEGTFCLLINLAALA